MYVCVCMNACMHACVHACMHACMSTCLRAAAKGTFWFGIWELGSEFCVPEVARRFTFFNDFQRFSQDHERRATPWQYPSYTLAISRPGASQIHRKVAKILVKNIRRVRAPNVYLPVQINLTFFVHGMYPRSTICQNRVFTCSFFE